MMAIDRGTPGKIIARCADATASYFIDSKRVIVVSDKGRFDCAQSALDELRDEVGS